MAKQQDTPRGYDSKAHATYQAALERSMWTGEHAARFAINHVRTPFSAWHKSVVRIGSTALWVKHVSHTSRTFDAVRVMRFLREKQAAYHIDREVKKVIEFQSSKEDKAA